MDRTGDATNTRATVFVVDDDDDLRLTMAEAIQLSGTHDVEAFGRAEPVLNWVKRGFYGAIVCDVRLPGLDGLAFLSQVLEIDAEMPVILITGHGDIPLAVKAIRAGAYDFLEKPFSAVDLAGTLGRAVERRRLVLENRELRRELHSRVGLETQIVGRSAVMVALRNAILAIAPTDADVLIFGETGAGKEVVARAIHQESERNGAPFVALNCGALPAEIIESELFGHEQGAFTGATKLRVGKLEAADGGTILLDEIESMPVELQVKLLRVIETRSIERLGSNKTINLDIRFIAATKSDLSEQSAKGNFRSDLYYRLNVVSVSIPPLRDRREDVPHLFYHLAREARTRYSRPFNDVPLGLMDRLMRHDWPGNVRELRNIVDRWVLNVPLGPDFGDDSLARTPLTEFDNLNLSDAIADFEKRMIVHVLSEAPNVTTAATILGVTRKTLYDKMHKHEIPLKHKASEDAY